MSLTATDMSQVVGEFISAFNDADLNRIRSLIAPDLSYAENGSRRRIDGPDASLDYVRAVKDAFPDLQAAIQATAISDDTVALRMILEGTHKGVLQSTLGPIQPSGNHVSVVATGWHRFNGDLICEIHHHVDALTLLQQIGALAG